MMKNTMDGWAWAQVALYYTASIQLLCLLSGFSVQNPSVVIWVKGRRTKYVLCQRRNSKIDTLLVLPLSDFVSLSVDVTLNKFSFSEQVLSSRLSGRYGTSPMLNTLNLVTLCTVQRSRADNVIDDFWNVLQVFPWNPWCVITCTVITHFCFF